MISAQLPGGSLSLTGNAFAALQPKYELRATGQLAYMHANIYSIPACPPTHPRYCFSICRDRRQRMEWEVLEVEIDLSIPGPIKTFSRISQQYTVRRPTNTLHDRDEDILLCFPSGLGCPPRGSLNVQSVKVGTQDKGRLAKLGGVGKLPLCGLLLDKGAGYVIISAAEDWPIGTQIHSFIWWLDERKPRDMVYLRMKELISSWSRGLWMMGGFTLLGLTFARLGNRPSWL